MPRGGLQAAEALLRLKVEAEWQLIDRSPCLWDDDGGATSPLPTQLIRRGLLPPMGVVGIPEVAPFRLGAKHKPPALVGCGVLGTNPMKLLFCDRPGVMEPILAPDGSDGGGGGGGIF